MTVFFHKDEPLEAIGDRIRIQSQQPFQSH